MPEPAFEELRAEREMLHNFLTTAHRESLLEFKEPDRPWFRRQQKPEEPNEKRVRHLSSTASCLESLAEVPEYESVDWPHQAIAEEFARAALNAPSQDWTSEGEARIYCRVRTLPAILRMTRDETLESFKSSLKKHLDFVWKRLDIGDHRTQGIAELSKQSGQVSNRQGYPPNAFHTYWAIRLLREYRHKDFLPSPSAALRKKEAVARLWAQRTLASQTALISGEQPRFDAHQLAWALSTDVLCRVGDGDRSTTADSQHVEIYDAALAAFFSEQRDGRWRLYEPLFHYTQAGNAYCYTYETLAELLRLALLEADGRVLRDLLRGYATNLISAWHHAKETALPLGSGRLGWCSGHHPHRTFAEAWATASVFSYLQNLRCLIGYWTAEEAKRDLSVRRPDHSPPEKGREILVERGDTWRLDGKQTVARQLAMLFLHPIAATARRPKSIDPDRPLVEEARSAVLFGPPGTSKTTLVESLAGALGWEYLEVHASDFLSEGVNRVPAKADSIFLRLMELDHCVILFDEIDELIRLRNDADSDPFGRFLTTSMLPKLAKLWEQKRVLFFVATNDIEAADPAIKRSQRFDAAIFVPPPAFEKKRQELRGRLDGPLPSDLTLPRVEKDLRSIPDSVSNLGVFALLRWDQIADLAHRIAVREGTGEDRNDALKAALGELGTELIKSDWHDRKDSNGDPENLTLLFERWHRQASNDHRDHRDKAMLKFDSSVPKTPWQQWIFNGSNDGHYVIVDRMIEGSLELEGDIVVLSQDGQRVVDRSGLFVFEAE